MIKFSKMHGLGNDFVVINAIDQAIDLTSDMIRFMADRHRGIGCDQLLLVESATVPEADFAYRIYNADGSEVAQCGNGARCFARFVRDQGLTDKTTITVETHSGLLQLMIMDGDLVRVDMGRPRFELADIPFKADSVSPRYTLPVAQAGRAEPTRYEIAALSMGNPHAVLRVDDVMQAPVAEIGPLIESHVQFPERVNVGFMEIEGRHHIRLRVYERGAGETLACGSGACAAMVAGRLWGLLDEKVTVALPGGSLLIEWSGEDGSVYMTGSAIHIFEGNIQL